MSDPPPDAPAADSLDALARSYGEALERSPSLEPEAVEEPSPEETAPPSLRQLVEAMLFIGGPPLTPARAAEAVRGLTAAEFAEVIDGLNKDYRAQGRPYRIQPREHGYEMALVPRYQRVRERLQGAVREARLSPAALDVLSLVAYRQPATRAEVESLRGNDCGAPLRQLVRLGLIIVQRGVGRGEFAYSTTPRFLNLFQLRSLDDLPRTQDLRKL